MVNKKLGTSIDNDGINDGVMAGIVNGDVDNRRYNVFKLPENRSKLPSIITKIVEVLSQLTLLSDDELVKRYKVDIKDLKVFDIPEKITHNDVVKYKATILEYGHYNRICDEAFNIIDNNIIGSKTRILRDIKDLYDEYKGQLLLDNKGNYEQEIDIIRKNSDYIIDMIKGELKSRILNEVSPSFFYEDIEDGLIRVVCYAFEQCKILEKP